MAYPRIGWDRIDRNKFPATLRRYRLFRGMTQAQLAEKVGVKNTTISNYEKAVSLPDYDTLIKIAKTLRVDPGEFYVSWRFGDADNEEFVPQIVQVEKDFISRSLSRWFVALPFEYIYVECRAFLVPKEYLPENEPYKHFIVITPTPVYKDGDAVAVIANREISLLGILNTDKDGNQSLKPIKKWNPDYDVSTDLKSYDSYKILGKIISYSHNELVIDSDT